MTPIETAGAVLAAVAIPLAVFKIATWIIKKIIFAVIFALLSLALTAGGIYLKFFS